MRVNRRSTYFFARYANLPVLSSSLFLILSMLVTNKMNAPTVWAWAVISAQSSATESCGAGSQVYLMKAISFRAAKYWRQVSLLVSNSGGTAPVRLESIWVVYAMNLLQLSSSCLSFRLWLYSLKTYYSDHSDFWDTDFSCRLWMWDFSWVLWMWALELRFYLFYRGVGCLLRCRGRCGARWAEAAYGGLSHCWKCCSRSRYDVALPVLSSMFIMNRLTEILLSPLKAASQLINPLHLENVSKPISRQHRVYDCNRTQQ